MACFLFAASFWTVEEVDLSKDMTDWNGLKVFTADMLYASFMW